MHKRFIHILWSSTITAHTLWSIIGNIQSNLFQFNFPLRNHVQLNFSELKIPTIYTLNWTPNKYCRRHCFCALPIVHTHNYLLQMIHTLVSMGNFTLWHTIIHQLFCSNFTHTGTTKICRGLKTCAWCSACCHCQGIKYKWHTASTGTTVYNLYYVQLAEGTCYETHSQYKLYNFWFQWNSIFLHFKSTCHFLFNNYETKFK